MQFSDEGYIIRLRKHGESSLILTVLTRNHGKISGYVKNCLHKKTLSIYQLGNLVRIEAFARVEENMLNLRVELEEAGSVNFITDGRKLAALSSFCALCDDCLAEQEPLERFYYYVESFMELINEDNWLAHYCFFEFYLLEQLGIGLDLSECAATGRVDNLRYVSPKSGRAVCEEAGFLYRDKLFSYPQFIVEKNYRPNPAEMADLLKMTEFFLQKNFFNTHGLKFPTNRANLLIQLNI